MTPLDPQAVEREIDRLDKRVGAVEVVVTKSVAWDMEIHGLHEDLADCRKAVERVHDELRRYKDEEQRRLTEEMKAASARRESERKERKRDRWTYVTTVIAALAVMATIVSIAVSNT